MSQITEYSINLRPNVISAVSAADTQVLKLLIEAVLDDEGTLYDMLDHYCHDDRGSVSYSSVDIDEDSSTVSQDKAGFLFVTFDEVAHYGCKDINKNDYRECEIGFKINVPAKKITFSVPESSRASYYHGND